MLIKLMVVVKYLGGEPSGVALKRHLIIHQLIGLVKKFDVRFGLEFSTVWASLFDFC